MFTRASTRPSGRGGLRLRQIMMLVLPLFLFLLFLVFFSSRPDDIKEPKVGNAFSLTNKKVDEQQAAKRQIGNVLNRLGEAAYVKNSDLPDLNSIPDDENVEDEEIDAGKRDLREEKGDDWN